MSLREGYSVREIENRLEHNTKCHEDYACFRRRNIWWNKVINQGLYFAYGLYDKNDEPICTLLFGNADHVVKHRAGINDNYDDIYMSSTTFDQQPRILDGHKVVLLECIPKGRRLHSDYKATEIPSQIAKEWYEGLEMAKDYLEWEANDPVRRVKASDFLKLRNKRIVNA